MKRISSLLLSSLLALMLILSGCAGKEQKTEKQTGNQSTSVEKISDNILDEMEGPPKNGHTIERHVGKPEEDLKNRLKTDKVSAASTYYDKETATKAVKDSLKQHDKEIQDWLKNSKEARLVLNTTHSFPVGKTVIKKNMNVKDKLVKTVTVLARDKSGDLGYKIITSYPSDK
ncbi:RNase A-like domain-containing lipoprotein [Bacillus wiedmannii]|uniref:RNase A-like domain-containing lipoprotein n=1 Tax=Bacillus wiedmannii TaxID=1890302 RepID=UPI0011587AF9|nr:RNase A-like domain-containing lipoprotein [Bacillus wiedmannii]